MKARFMAVTLCLAALLLGPSAVLAQAPAGPGGMGQGGMMQMMGMMQQMGGMMERMAEMQKRMSEMLGAK